MKRPKSYLKRKSLIADVKPQERHLKVLLQYAAVPLTLITALLYLLGYVYYGTYLSFWGLSESLFPLSKDQSVISGLFRSLLLSSTMLSKLALVMYLLLAMMFATFVSTYRPITEWFSNLFSRFKSKAVPALRRNVAITSVHDKLMDTAGLIAGGIGFFLFILALVVFPCQWSINQAKKDARKEYAEILSGKESGQLFLSRVKLQIKNESKTYVVYSGHLIQTSTTHAALYNKDRGMMIFPMANIARIEMSEKVTGN